jgi:hypothetical protein
VVELTPRGRDAAQWLVSSRVALAEDLFAGMSAERLACFTEGLSEVTRRLRAAMRPPRTERRRDLTEVRGCRAAGRAGGPAVRRARAVEPAPQDVPADAQPWPYAALVAPVLWLWIFGSATELVVFHLIIPWETVRLVVDVLSAWGLIWMMGTAGRLPHPAAPAAPDELRVRNSVYHDVCVPTAAIVSAVRREAELPSSVRSLQVAGVRRRRVRGERRGVGTHERRAGAAPRTPLKTARGTLAADVVRLWVDDPRSFVAQLQRLSPARR